MRPLLLFLAVVLAFFAILKFYPAGQEGEVVGAAPNGQAGFLERPAGATLPARPAAQSSAGPARSLPDPRSEAPSNGASGPASSAPTWLDDFEGVAQAGPEEIELARAMVHERCAALEERIERLGAALSEDRGRAILAFGRAYRGDLAGARTVAQGIRGALPELDERFLRAQMEGTRPPLRPVSALAHGPLALAMSMLAAEQLVLDDLAAKGWPQAVTGLSDLLLAELDAPWQPSRARVLDWAQRLNEAQERHRWNPRGAWPHAEVVVERGDSLSSVLARYRREHPNRRISSGLVAHVNGIQGDLIHPGDVLRVPTEEVSVRVDIDLRMLFVLMGDEVAAAWECAVGAAGQETIPGRYAAGAFEKDPWHFPKGQAPVPFGDPQNPLGSRWIAWWDADGTENNLSLGFHGTNQANTVGTAASRGCVRLHNADVELLYALLPRFAPILVE
ncbi:MAG: L,D-transpeptidase family protein [Planctomycetota bacterium]